MVNGYNKTQIRLHWAIFILIVLQFVLHEPIAEAWDVFEKGGDFVGGPLIAQHIIGGTLVLLLVLWRLSIRFSRGVPALPKEEPAVLKGIAHLTHWVFYALMILLPISGLVAFFGRVETAADAHELMRGLMLLFVVLHIAGALFQQFVLKTNIMDRMRTPSKD